MELKGSKTEQNLKAAFAGESQARNKYTFFAEKARKEGHEDIARIFLETAENERAHAKKELDFLKGVEHTETNLKEAADGEHHETTRMYPEFEQVARQEGFTQIANFFKAVAEIEARHEARYRDLLKHIHGKKAVAKGEEALWKCTSCGWVAHDVEEPTECPTCSVPTSTFEPFDPTIYPYERM